MRKEGTVTAGNVLVDGLGVGDVGNIVLRDRLLLSEDGMLIVVVGVSTTEGGIVSGPEIISRGFIYTGDNSADDIVDEMKQIAISVLQEMDLKEFNASGAKILIQKQIKAYLARKLKRSPMVLPVIVQI